MDVNFRLLSERLRRLLLAGEEEGGTLPDAAKQHIQNLLTESEIVSSFLRDYEDDISRLVYQVSGGQKIDSPHLLAFLKEINRFANESDRVVDGIIISIILQQQDEISSCHCSKEELCVFHDDALVQLRSKIIAIKQRMHQFQSNKSIPGEAPDSFSISTSGYKKRDGISGVDDKMEELLDLLIEGEPQLSIVAVVDSTGFNKTAFAAEAFSSNYVKNYFDCRAWVSFNYSGMVKHIMKSVMPPSELIGIVDKDDQRRKTALRDYLMDKRYLIVLDDAWSNEIWDDFTHLRDALPDNQNGSRVLTTLTNINVLESCLLENREQIQLDLVPATRPLRATYQGWPFVFLYYGSKSLKENMKDMVFEPIESLSASILGLPLYLKLCCLYLCVFYEVFEMSTRELYQLWIAEGFIPDESEATAEQYLEELINRGFIGVKKRKSGGKIKICTFPFITWASSSGVAQAMEFIKFLSKELKDESVKDVKRLSVMGNLTEFISSENSPDTYLHSLLYRTSDNHPLAPTDCKNICKKFKLLRVLDLGSQVLNQYPTGIENLILLRYLKLNLPSLKSLPSSLCNLLNLQTLDMSSSYIDHTPDDIWKMNKLRHLNFGYIKLPAHLGKCCSSLENLNFISDLHASSCTADILGKLPNLKTLQIYGDLSSYQFVLSKSLCKLRSLESLKLVNEKKMTQPSHLFLSEFQFPQTLIHLNLLNTELKDDPMPTLEKLPQLQVLKLKKNSYSGRKLVCGSNGFPCLKILHLRSMLWLEEWIMGTGVMPKLENLVINPCAYLRRIPEELWRIRTLCKLELGWPQPELRQKLREFEDMEQYNIKIFPYGL